MAIIKQSTHARKGVTQMSQAYNVQRFDTFRLKAKKKSDLITKRNSGVTEQPSSRLFIYND